MALQPLKPRDEATIHMDDDPSLAVEGTMEVKAFGVGHVLGAKAGGELKRPLNLNGQGATRCKIYHSKIAAPSLEFLEQQINQWVDGEKVEIKHVSQVIGVMEGKALVPNLIVTIWY
jgi:hypothetical protein